MPAPSFLILAGPDQWRLAVVADGEAELHPLGVRGGRIDSDAADEIRRALLDHGHRGEGVALGLPSQWVMVAGIDVDNLPRRHRRQALLYRLEEQLPLAAEAVVADFVQRDHAALAAAARADRLIDIVDRLEAAGVMVQLVSPAAALALQAQAADPPDHRRCFLAADLDGRIELAALDAGTPASWQSLPQDPAAFVRALRAELLGDPPAEPAELVMLGLNGDFLAAASAVNGLQVRHAEPVDLAAARGAADALRGRVRPWFDFRRGPLGPADRLRPVRRPLTACAAAAAVLLATMAGALLWRARGHRRLAGDHAARQADVFHQAFPGQRLPPSVGHRLESEARKLGRVRTVTADMPGRRCALDALRDALVGLPAGVHWRILEIQIDPARMVLEGQARSHADAEKIAAALRAAGRFDVDPPRTERLESGAVAFAITARRLAPPAGRRTK